MQPSRRAFLMGRRPVQTPWAAFVQRLALVCHGKVRDLGEGGADGTCAILTPASEADVVQARKLCAEYRVTLELEGAAGPFAPSARPRLRVDPVLLTELTRLDGDVPQWRAQPGVTLAELARAGLRQFAGLPGDMTLAQWVAAPAPWPAGHCAASGLVAADVLLADGVEETLGAFGETDVQPLRSATVQRLVPALFQLASGGDAFATNDGYHWLGRYRLDALKPVAPATVNLAQLLLGHGGTLAWLQGAVLIDVPPGGDRQAEGEPGPAPAAPGLATVRLDGRVKTQFDPDGCFPEIRWPEV
ncbi:FAD-binding protein [Achromobacter spanius]|uniref:FAD-binding protein n=1 Tax=Achromobacter spanius TaxID=217203 RepID=A0A2S0ICM7_9BURK|nr:FAD-binding protein [Achromobacter spanius]AVJ29527.1 FAD-binding protein [Achromobacter spanius]